jgi:integrase
VTCLAATESENFAHVDEKDLPELLAKMDDYNGDALTRFGLKLIAYCFPRTSELIEAPWTEFDLDRARWDIPAERMKMKTPHIIPLSRQVVEVLRALKLLLVMATLNLDQQLHRAFRRLSHKVRCCP